LIIVGAGGHGRVVADAAESSGQWDSIGFLDARFPQLRKVDGWPVVGRSHQTGEPELRDDDEFVVGIGNCRTRTHLLDELTASGRRIATVIHRSATVSKYAEVGEGCVIFAGACVNIGARLARGVIVNTAASIDHDCQVAEGVHVCPGARLAGDVTVGRLSWFGIGACARQGVVIGEEVVIGAGAAVVTDIAAGSLAVGVPARVKVRT
jgi:sugar O-acyltransferase (sialic acid O-acetyltransferase NeuD family)